MPPAQSMTRLRDLPRANEEEDEVIVSVYGKTYDLTKWMPNHPGGAILRQYNGLDATTAFDALHGAKGHAVLKKMTPIAHTALPSPHDEQTTQENEELLEAFDDFKRDLIDRGFFKSNFIWHVYKVVTTVSFIAFGAYLAFQGWFMASAISMGVGWQQLGWLGHDYCHHNGSDNRDFNYWMGLFLGNLLQGYSSSWWKDRHNSHHAVTNIVGHDPDIDNVPLLAWDPQDLDDVPSWAKGVVPYQAYYFLFLLPALRVTWCLNSVFFAWEMRSSVFKFYNQWWFLEFSAIVVHWSCVFYLMSLMDPITALKWFAISEGISGFGIAIVVFFNHYSVEKFDGQIASNFVKMQLMTTRNMTPGLVTDWICGGLNYQIEHHLFPTMPRHNLAACTHEVQQFAKTHNLPYMTCGFVEGTGYVLDFLNEMGALQAKRNAVEGK